MSVQKVTDIEERRVLQVMGPHALSALLGKEMLYWLGLEEGWIRRRRAGFSGRGEEVVLKSREIKFLNHKIWGLMASEFVAGCLATRTGGGCLLASDFEAGAFL